MALALQGMKTTISRNVTVPKSSRMHVAVQPCAEYYVTVAVK